MAEEKKQPYKNKRIECPHCGEEVPVMVTWEVKASPEVLHGDAAATTSREYWLSTQPEAVRQTLQVMNPVIEVFTKIFTDIHGTVPGIPEKPFMAWIRTAKPRAIPPQSSRALAFEYPGRGTRILASLGIAAILIDDVLTDFIPVAVLDGDALRGKAGIVRAALTDTNKISQWIRTKYGYVATPGLLLGELRQRCFGAFDQPGVTSN